jgi:hypothetical protein
VHAERGLFMGTWMLGPTRIYFIFFFCFLGNTIGNVDPSLETAIRDFSFLFSYPEDVVADFDPRF